jgi:hypothetical protein
VFLGLGSSVVVGKDGINKFDFGVGRGVVGRYTRFHKGRYFASVLLVSNVMGIHQAVYLSGTKSRRFIPCTTASSTSSQGPRHQSRSLRHLRESLTKFLALHSHHSQDPGSILCLWSAALSA